MPLQWCTCPPVRWYAQRRICLCLLLKLICMAKYTACSSSSLQSFPGDRSIALKHPAHRTETEVWRFFLWCRGAVFPERCSVCLSSVGGKRESNGCRSREHGRFRRPGRSMIALHTSGSVIKGRSHSQVVCTCCEDLLVSSKHSMHRLDSAERRRLDTRRPTRSLQAPAKCNGGSHCVFWRHQRLCSTRKCASSQSLRITLTLGLRPEGLINRAGLVIGPKEPEIEFPYDYQRVSMSLRRRASLLDHKSGA